MAYFQLIMRTSSPRKKDPPKMRLNGPTVIALNRELFLSLIRKFFFLNIFLGFVNPRIALVLMLMLKVFDVSTFVD